MVRSTRANADTEPWQPGEPGHVGNGQGLATRKMPEPEAAGPEVVLLTQLLTGLPETWETRQGQETPTLLTAGS